MPPLTTPYLGRVVRGGMTAALASPPAAGTNGLCGHGPKASRRGLMPLSLELGYFTYSKYGFIDCVDLRECSGRTGRNAALDATRDGAALT